MQTIRVLAIWLAGRAVGVDLSPRPYYVMGPLLFLVLLLPISVNGIAVRESFFVSFLGNLGVDADKAFATGFLFFVVTLCLSAPGAVLLGWQSLRGFTREPRPMADVSRRRRHLQRAAVGRAGARERARATRRSSSTTARPTARSSWCASAFPRRALIEQENKGLGGGSNAGMRVASGDWFLLLNSDAWATEGALERLVAFGEAHPEAAVVGPKLRYPDGRLQRSVRGFPTLWRLATEYLFLRKLAPRSRAFNAFYGDGFAHDAALRGGVPDGRGPARAARGRRYGWPLRRGLLHVQRGDGLALPLPPGGLEGALHP